MALASITIHEHHIDNMQDDVDPHVANHHAIVDHQHIVEIPPRPSIQLSFHHFCATILAEVTSNLRITKNCHMFTFINFV